METFPNSNPTSERVPTLLPLGTAVLWVGCLVIGLVGLRLHYKRPVAAKAPPPPVEAKFLPVRIEPAPVAMVPKLQLSDAAPDRSPEPSPTPIPSAIEPAAPPLTAVAVPSAAVGFALPVEGPVRIVQPNRAVPIGPASSTGATPAPGLNRSAAISQPLTFGEGDGKQPAPTYPREAVLARQEGTVVVRLVVGEDGRVQSAEADEPSPWPLLNQSALRTVREQWQFRRGPKRTYTVPIQFQLQSR